MIEDGTSSHDESGSMAPVKSMKRKKISENYERNELLRKAATHMENICKRKERDEADIYGEGWAHSYRKLSDTQKLFAKKACDEIFILGQLGRLTLNSVRNETLPCPTPTSTSCSSLPQSIAVQDFASNLSTAIDIKNSPSSQVCSEGVIVKEENDYSSFTEFFTDNSLS